MYVEKGNSFLPASPISEVEERYKIEKNAKAKIRLQCALLRKKGESQLYISRVTGLAVTTISDILRRFERRGIDGCYAIKQSGQPRRLSISQRIKLKRIILNSPEKAGLPFAIWTTKLVKYIMNREFGVDYVLIQVHRILKALGLSLQKARPEHLKANKKLQAEFKKKFDERLKSLENVDMRSYFWTKAHSNSSPT